MIEVRAIYKIFGREVEKAFPLMEQGYSKDQIHRERGLVIGLKDITIHIDKGELFVLMGLSGSGKSTLLRCINRLIEPTKGEIFLHVEKKIPITGLETRELHRIRKNYMSMVFQEFALFSWRSVLGNVTYGLEIQGVKREEREKKALSVLELVGLKEWAEAKPSELSGGMRQRVGLARALATDAPILLMDEPFSALDPLIKVKMQDELLNLQKTLKKTILFVTHDLDEALKIGDRIAIMEDGCIVQMGTPEEIIINPKTEYVANFIQNADVSNVLTAGTIAPQLEKGAAIDQEAHSNTYHLLGEEIQCIFNRDNQLERLVLRGESCPIKRLHHKTNFYEVEEKTIFAVTMDTPIKLLMKARMYSDQPFIIFSNQGEPIGILTEKDILKGLLK